MADLLLTLGHNASAIAIDIGGEIIAGYEEERLSKIKSDSHFPIKAIEEIGIQQYQTIYVTHWDPMCNLRNVSEKHWNPDLLPVHDRILTLHKDFTHHDAHMMSAQAFVGNLPDAWTIVADGFGNYGEVISIYGPNQKIKKRVFGYMASLGLMYQYAIAYLGMKMNEDEYKLLGYESHISDVNALEYGHLIDKITHHMLNGFNSSVIMRDDDPLFKITALLDTQLFWEEILEPCKKDRIITAYVVQSVLEKVLVYIIDTFNMKNVILVGGVFLNVKANNKILNRCDGSVSVMPLSGDQGVALGLYKHHNPDWVMPNNLFWGRRTLTAVDRPRTFSYSKTSNFGSKLAQLLRDNKIVNIVWGSMEFGPRALCHTTTLAQPSMENVEYINMVNGRSTIMPMGPVVSETKAEMYYPDLKRVHKSASYMVMALDYEKVQPAIRGAAHNLPLDDGFTGRPQVVRGFMKCIGQALSEFGILINTSFNIHGVPIVYDNEDIEKCVDYQQQRDVDKRIYTIILIGENHDI